MMIAICMCLRRNVIGDGYKNIMNNFENKHEIICIIPSAYSVNEFSEEFNDVIVDPVSQSKNRIISSIKFLLELKRIIKENNVNKIFIYLDNHWFNSLLSHAFKDIDYTVWVHDPVLHLGERKNAKIIRYMNSKNFFPNVKNFIVSYGDAKRELSKKYKINLNNIYVVWLPELPEMEFVDLKNRHTEIQYDLMFFGRIEKYKGINLLINTVKDMKDINLLIIGRGKEDKKVKEITEKCSNISFINEYVENYKLAEYINKSNLVILPYKEATGTQTIQIANYYNKPVIVNKVGSFKEYVVNGINGYIMDDYTKQCIKETIEKASKFKINRKEIEEFFNEKFSITRTVNSLMKILGR